MAHLWEMSKTPAEPGLSPAISINGTPHGPTTIGFFHTGSSSPISLLNGIRMDDENATTVY